MSTEVLFEKCPGESAAAGTKSRRHTISQLSREFGVTARTLHFYEDKGLLNPAREGQNRIFTRRDRARLKLILQGKGVGFSLSEIKEMLDLYDLRDGQVIQLRVALRKFGERIQHLEQQKADIGQAIADLRRTREIVRGMLKERENEEAMRGTG